LAELAELAELVELAPNWPELGYGYFLVRGFLHGIPEAVLVSWF
jgi:hypothetical protein